MLHPILGIDELLKPIVEGLMEANLETVLSLALTCRSLEEPALSSLWKEQERLPNLLKVLTNHKWLRDEQGIMTIVSGRDFLAYRPVQLPPGD